MDGNDVQVHRDEMLTVSVTRGDGSATVSLEGELDLATADLVEEALRGVEEQATSVVIDLRELEFIDSTGLSVMLEAAGRSQQNSHSLHIRRGSGQVEKVFALTGLHERLSFV